ncbi:hypothetical protein [Neotabrizicola shimadae]|uniref:Uncharacterized protein n=1 Tax=Neotabrizicola shimadae TaxID=2807096 RepID=A0A8G0ZQT4_9RHOB|nr:hypothetical protein [Neotabrizicola shimadae]QYZ69751.1 hypothetical protein JO391_18965 [Neotabrizicola shimadae]
MDEADLPGNDLVRTIGSTELADALVQIADASLGATIASGLLDQVPLFGMVHSIYKAGRSISERLALAKTHRFLIELSSIPKEERLAFSDELFASGKADEFAARVFLLLDQSDDFSKPQLIGRIVAAQVRGDCSVSECFMLCSSVNRSHFDDLRRLKQFRDGVQNEPESAERLFVAGLLTNRGIDGGGADEVQHPGGTIYHLSRLGQLLAPLV